MSKPNYHILFYDENSDKDTSWGQKFITKLAQIAQTNQAEFCEHMEKEIVEKLDYWKNAYPDQNSWEIFLENMGAVIAIAQLSNTDPTIRQRLIKLCDDIGLPE